MSECCREFQGSGEEKKSKTTTFSVCCSTLRFKGCVSVCLFFPLLWQRAVGRYLRYGDFCSPTRFSLFCWPSVKTETTPLTSETLMTERGADDSSHQDLLAKAALCWILQLTAEQQAAGNVTHCGRGLSMTASCKASSSQVQVFAVLISTCITCINSLLQ